MSTANTDVVLEVHNLRLRRERKELLRGVSFRLLRGEFTVLIGPNGAGKSSVIRAITGEWPMQGTLQLFGQPRGSWPRQELARRVAVMPQQPTLSFDFTVQEVVAMGRLPHRQLREAENTLHVERAIDELQLTRLAHRSYLTLSGGERQRVHFARAVVQISGHEERSLLILDEPTAALDLAQQVLVLDAARRKTALGMSVLAVVHDLNLAARYADRVLILRAGRLHADGTVASTYRADVLSEAFGVGVDVELAASDGAPMVFTRRQEPFSFLETMSCDVTANPVSS